MPGMKLPPHDQGVPCGTLGEIKVMSRLSSPDPRDTFQSHVPLHLAC